MEDRVEAALTDLRRSAEKIKSLFAWRELKAAETKPGTPPSFQIYENIDAEIKTEEGFFLNLANSIRDVIQDRTDERSVRQKRRLAGLENQLRLLGTTKGL
jgi:hypothetical protein